MTETQEWTGQQVRTWREEHKLSRRELAELCGFPTQTRLFNIEQKDSWKSGDREALAFAMASVESSGLPHKKRSRNKAEAESRIDALEAALRNDGKLIREQTNPDEVADEIVTMTGDDTHEDPSPTVWTEPEPNGVSKGSISDPVIDICPDCGNYRMSSAHVKACKAPLVVTDEDIGLYEDEEEQDEPSIVVDPYEEMIAELRAVADGEKLLTNSEVSVWNRCRRKWWLAFYRRLAYGQIDYSGPREIGNRIHRALAAYYVPDGQEPKDPREALNEAIEEDWRRIEEQVRAHGAQGDVDEYLSARAVQYQEACTLEKAVIESYVQWITETAQDANIVVLEPEATIHAKLEGEVAGDKVSVIALGKLDVRVRRASDGVKMFMDHKSTGSLTEPLKTLHMDPQMLHYHLLEWLALEGKERCDAALYNMLKKNKRSATAKPPFFDRVEVHHNEFEIDAYRRRLLGAARDVLRVTHELDDGADPMTVVYPNPTKNCAWDCDFFVICPMFDDGSRVEDAITALYHEQDPLARYSKEQEVGGI